MLKVSVGVLFGAIKKNLDDKLLDPIAIEFVKENDFENSFLISPCERSLHNEPYMGFEMNREQIINLRNYLNEIIEERK